MAPRDNELLIGDLKAEGGATIASGVEVELDRLGEIHVASFRLPDPTVGEEAAYTLELPGGRAIRLYVLADGYQPDGTVRAAVVGDSGEARHGLGLNLGPAAGSGEEDEA